MSCRLLHCTTPRSHHHHLKNGTPALEACMCSRPTNWLQPISVEQLIDFAAKHPGKITGHTDSLLRSTFGITAVRYLQLLNRAIRTEEALAHDPITTHRLLREAEQRARTRTVRITGR